MEHIVSSTFLLNNSFLPQLFTLSSILCHLFSRDESCNLFEADDIDATSYTHIIFSFAQISDSGTLEAWDFKADVEGGQYEMFINAKKKFPGTKAMVAVGGWTHNDPDNERLYRFSNSAASSKSRMKFAQSTVGKPLSFCHKR